MTELLLRGLPQDARIVATPDEALLQARLQRTIRHRGVMLVSGDHGSGKKVALLSCLNRQDLPYAVIDTPTEPSPKELTRVLHQAVFADRDEYALHDMQNDLVDALAGPARILVVNRADRLSARSADHLHYLHSRPGANWTLVFLGGPECVRILSKDAELRGAILQAHVVPLLHGEELLPVLRGMHRLFATADTGLLLTIDRQLCDGRLKAWATFLLLALDIREQAVEAGLPPLVLDVDLARAVTAQMPQFTKTRKP